MTKLSVDANELPFVPTAHAAGLKKIFFLGDATLSALTQFAFGKLSAGEIIPPHQHPTMEEYFYFLSGTGTYNIGGSSVDLKADVAVKIPAGTLHTLVAEETLEFLFFGIAIDTV